MPDTSEQTRADYAKVVAKAWSDETFKAKLLSDPHAALSEAGVDVPEGLTVRAVEDTAETFHLVLPPPPAESELADEALESIAGGLLLSFCMYCETPG